MERRLETSQRELTNISAKQNASRTDSVFILIINFNFLDRAELTERQQTVAANAATLEAEIDAVSEEIRDAIEDATGNGVKAGAKTKFHSESDNDDDFYDRTSLFE